MISRNHDTRGFALLLSVIIVSIVLAIGLSILDLSIKEVQLSTTTRDSEEAFHATNAGLECARYWRRTLADSFEAEGADAPEITCFEASDGGSEEPVDNDGTGGFVNRFRYELDWDSAIGTRCSIIDMVVLVSSTTVGYEADVSDLAFMGFAGEDPDPCPVGGRCTIAAVKGYGASCDTIDSTGTIEREVLLRF